MEVVVFTLKKKNVEDYMRSSMYITHVKHLEQCLVPTRYKAQSSSHLLFQIARKMTPP